MKIQPCLCLYYFFFHLRKFFKLCSFNDKKHTKKILLWIIQIQHIFKILMTPCPYNHQYMAIHKFSELMIWFYII